MNTKHSVNALSGKRSLLRRFVTVAAAASVLMLGVVAQADGGGKGSFELTTIAGVGDSYTGKLDVKGDGKFSVKDEGDKLVFTSNVADGELNMKDGRQKHTVGDDSKLGLKKGQKVKLTIEKSKLSFPEAGKESSGSAPGKLSMLGKESSVTVKYSVKEDGGKYVIKNASFEFDYTKHVADGKKVCLMLVCVKPMVSISITGGVVEAKK
ncbi:MAG TPA: hypothetical protein VNG33_12055 [Polyangiaceae bacterium]|nr:hypothetical protein [Polyangiaceae bacterium]